MTDPRLAFLAKARGAIEDQHLQAALDVVTGRFTTLRRDAFRGVPDPDGLRQRAKAIKERTLSELGRHLERLAVECHRAGTAVHVAADAGECREIVLGLARARGVRSVVKSKSMVTEEVHLNAALEAAGIGVAETDVGEWIVQLAGESPSHIIAPAIHKTKEQVAALFSAATGESLPPDPEMLTAAARRALREKFLRADMGISGANFAVAETGTIVLVTNEGNDRLVTTLPRIHVAIMGMEKVVPSLVDLMVFLEILARSATGQKMSVYTNLLRGPRRPGDGEGPEEVHLIILDNGRSRQVGGPLEESLQCLRCGACLNVCPVYKEVGGHTYEATYPGPIGILVTSFLGDSPKNLSGASTLCGACLEVCPVQMDIPRMLLDLRREAGEKHHVGYGERLAFGAAAAVMESPALYRLAARLARVLQWPFLRAGRLRRLPGPLAGWTRFRDLPPVAARPFHLRWRDLEDES
ncbi:MAG TPA: LutB/LldF family L-lactate oxidation iron-sulfur protein [Candidatus Methylomirabilis sp.]|nr:LutB/LldF family L-lactate oxidation iron-sulfur protein [Candidatus Methylomirabilis sp.]